MLVESCIPVIPSADIEKSLRFWVDGLGLSMDREMREDGRLVGCMVHNERLAGQGFAVSDIVEREYGQTEFFMKDDDGYAHCFGVATSKGS